MRSFVAFVLALGLLGCSGDGGGGGIETVSFTFEITGWDPETGLTGRLEGVEICQVGVEFCIFTDTEGQVTLDLPPGEEVAFTVIKEGYQSYLMAGVVPPVPLKLRGGISTNERIEAMHGLMTSPYPMEGTGDIVIIVAEGSAFAGATLELTGSTGKRFYYDDFGNWDPDLTETSSYGGAPLGGFTEVGPGEVEVTWGGTAEDCTIFKGWPSDKENTMRLPVWDGFMTHADLTCSTQ